MSVKRNIPFSPPDLTEAEAEELRKVLLSGWITTGPRTRQLERQLSEYLHTSRTVCLNSATAAMEMALHMLGIGPGDEVIVPAYTYTASASVATHVGARLVLVDIQRGSLEMDYDKLSDAITEKTKVVVPVDIAGIVCDYDRVRQVVESKRHLFRPANELQRRIGRIVISADCAHAFGAQRDGKMAGEIADFSSFSFHAVKNFTTAEGGALTWNLPFGNEVIANHQYSNGWPLNFNGQETWNDCLYRLSQLYSLHGQSKDALAKTKLGAWEYDIVGPWYKCNMTDISAAIGLVQFQRYPEMLQKRRRYIETYDNALRSAGVESLCHYGPHHASSGHLYISRFAGRTRQQCNEIIEQLAEKGVATNVHYKPLPMFTAYRNLGFDIADYPNSFSAFQNEITLPLNTRMTQEDVEYVVEMVLETLAGK